MNPLTTNSTIEEIEQAGEYVTQVFKLKDEYIRELEEVIEIQRKLLTLSQNTIAAKDKHIKDLKQQLDELMDLTVRATALASKNVI